MNVISRYIILLSCLFLMAASNTTDFNILNIDQPDILANVQQRLIDAIKKKPIIQTQPEQLRSEIENAVSPYGYFKPRVSINLRTKTIHIQLGEPLLIHQFNLDVIGEGRHEVEIQNVIKTLPLQKNQVLNTETYLKAKDSLLSAAEKLGYVKAYFKVSQIIIDKQQYTSKINLIFDTGPRFYFGQVRFAPSTISPELLHRYLPFRFGQPYSPDKILELNNNLRASGYFKNVVVNPTITSNTAVPIEINLKPAKRYSYTLGAGYGTDTGPRGVASFKVVPVNARGHKLNVFLKGSFTENTFQTQYLMPGRDPIHDQYSIGGGLTTLNYTNSYSNSLLLSFAQQHHEKNYQRLLSINELVESYNYFTAKRESNSLLYPKAVLSWGNAGDSLFVPSGYNITILGLAASRVLLSEINLAQAQVDGKAALMISPIRTRFYFHGIQGVTAVDRPEQIPVSLAQFLGGTTNLKGYSYNSIGPGKLQSYAGIEIQKETFKNWYIMGVFDVGNVYEPYNTPTKYDVGIGLMWASPFGLIKAGVAQPTTGNFNKAPSSSPRLFINAGTDL